MMQKPSSLAPRGLFPSFYPACAGDARKLRAMRANAIEAAEQCGILDLAEISSPLTFDQMIASRDPNRLLVFCDEDAEVKDPVVAFGRAARAQGSCSPC